jgi:hypothetical protein
MQMAHILYFKNGDTIYISCFSGKERVTPDKIKIGVTAKDVNFMVIIRKGG